MFSFVDAGRGRVVKGKKVIEIDGKRMGMKTTVHTWVMKEEKKKSAKFLRLCAVGGRLKQHSD